MTRARSKSPAQVDTRRTATDAGLLGAMASVAAGAALTLIASSASPESEKIVVTIEQAVCESRPAAATELIAEPAEQR